MMEYKYRKIKECAKEPLITYVSIFTFTYHALMQKTCQWITILESKASKKRQRKIIYLRGVWDKDEEK